MELLKRSRRRSRLSDAAYVGLNIGLALILLFAMLSTQTIWLALIIVLVSKWRVFAVRPRFWGANILANSIDTIIGVSYVVFLYATSGSIGMQIALTVGYIVWLLFVKPRSKRLFVSAQAGAAVYTGVTALSMFAYNLDSVVFVLGVGLIGYLAARHVLMAYDEKLIGVFCVIWGFVLAQLGWLGYHWLFAYSLPNIAGLKLSQLALFALLLSFLAERAVDSHHRHGQVRMGDMIVPLVFVVALIGLLLTLFNSLSPSGSL